MKVVEKKDFDQTINLPQKTIVTDGELIKRESFFIENLQDGSKFNIANQQNKKSNNNVNISEIPMNISEKTTPTNIINKVLKDIIARYSILKGNYVNHSLGFCHTDEMLKKTIKEEEITPIEEKQSDNKKTSRNNKNKNTQKSTNYAHIKKEIGIVEKNRMNLEKNIRNQIYEISNLGTMINYSKHYYSTLKLNITNSMLEKFATLYDNGLIYSEKRPVPWCTNCGKSAIPKDIKYRKSKVKNTYFLCKIKNDNGNLKKFGDLNNTFLVCSTIRPWTLLHSTRLSIAKDTKFSLVEVEDTKNNITRYIIGSEFVSHVMEDAFFIKYKVVEEFDSSLLNEITAVNPIKTEKELKVYSIDKKYVHIDNRNMTGINLLGNVDSYLDYIINKKLNYTENLNCVTDAKGNFNNFIPEYKGKNYKEVNNKVISILKANNMLFLDVDANIIMSRCKECNHEITYRYLNKWYLKRSDEYLSKLKAPFEDLLRKITYNKYNNISILVKGFIRILSRRELSISNERKSSVPIPAFYCASCGNEIISPLTISICKDILNEKGIDTWNKMTPEEILNGQVKCQKCGCDFLFKEDSSLNDAFKLLTIPLFNVKIEDDDTSTNISENNNTDIKNANNKNFCIETRKDFLNKLKVISFDIDAVEKINSITHVMLHTKVKKNINTIAQPLLLDKSENNSSTNLITTDLGIIDIVKRYGIDVLRLWAVYRSDSPNIKLTEGDIKNVRTIYIQFRKTIKYILSNLYDFNPIKDSINLKERDNLDIYIYSKMQQLESKLDNYYNELNFPAICKLLNKFCIDILQNNYFEVIKYRLYITPKDGFYRRSVQTNLYDLLSIFVTYLQPILPLLFEESWPYIFHNSPEEERNILLFRDIKDLEKIELNDDQKIWHKIFLLRRKIIPLVNKACNEGIIKTSLEARVIITCSQTDIDFIKNNYYDIIRTLNVSVIVFKLGHKLNIEVKKALGIECTRCKNYSTSIGINYKYRHLCKQCAEIEDSIVNNRVPKSKPPKEIYIEEEHRNDDDVKTQDDIDIPIPPPTSPEIPKIEDIEFDDRLGDKMDEAKINKIKELNSNSITHAKEIKEENDTLEEKYHFGNSVLEKEEEKEINTKNTLNKDNVSTKTHNNIQNNNIINTQSNMQPINNTQIKSSTNSTYINENTISNNINLNNDKIQLESTKQDLNTNNISYENKNDHENNDFTNKNTSSNSETNASSNTTSNDTNLKSNNTSSTSNDTKDNSNLSNFEDSFRD